MGFATATLDMRANVLLLWLSAALGSACAPEEEGGTAENAHTVGAFVDANVSFSWVETDYTTARQALRTQPGRQELFSGKDMSLPDDHPLRQRAQYWFDRMHDVVAEAQRAKGMPLLAPKPVAKIIPSTEVNAWVSIVPACRGTRRGIDMQQRTIVQRSELFDALQGCVVAEQWPSEPTTWLSSSDTPCRAAQGPGCVSHGLDVGERPGLLSSLPFVHVTTGLFAQLDEPGFVWTLAHEAAHYYRGHRGTTYREPVHYFYFRDQTARRPVPGPSRELDAVARLYEDVRRAPLYTAVPDQSLHPLTMGFVLSVANWLISQNISPCSPRTLQAPQSYAALERQIIQCAKDVPLNAATWSLLARSQEGVRIFTESPVLPTRATLAMLLDAAQVRAQELEAAKKKLDATLRSRAIGFYTEEQEADEIALDLVTRLGFGPDSAIRGVLRFMRALEDGGGSGSAEIPSARCEAWLAAGFQERGQRVYVPMGDPSNPHHAHCYRIFNLYEEQRTHRYGAQGTPRFPSVPWAALQQEASTYR